MEKKTTFRVECAREGGERQRAGVTRGWIDKDRSKSGSEGPQ